MSVTILPLNPSAPIKDIVFPRSQLGKGFASALPPSSIEIKLTSESEDLSSSMCINHIIELARNRAALIANIRELLLRDETHEVIPLVRILCGLES